MLFKVRLFLLWLFLVFGVGFGSRLCAQTISQIQEAYRPDMSKGLIYISKDQLTLTLYDANGNVVLSYPIACGRVIGQKKQKGDNRTPEGLFYLQMVQNASKWGHDFGDGNGFIKDAYGPWFMRLKTGFNGIGIHGTHAPESIGTRASEGCIRVENSNLEILHQYVKVGMSVIIGPEDGYLYADMPVKRVTPSSLDKPLLADAEPRRSDAARIEMTIDAPAMDLVESSTIMLKQESFILADNVPLIDDSSSKTDNSSPADDSSSETDNESPIEDSSFQLNVGSTIEEPIVLAENESQTQAPVESVVESDSDLVLAEEEVQEAERELLVQNDVTEPEGAVIPEEPLASEMVEVVPAEEPISISVADVQIDQHPVEEPLLLASVSQPEKPQHQISISQPEELDIQASVQQKEEPKNNIIRKVKEGHAAMIDINPDCLYLADLPCPEELRLAYVPKYIIFNNQ